MSRSIFGEAIAGPKGLLTEVGANRRLNKVIETIIEEDVRYMVVTENGRFFPVVHLREHQRHLMLFFAERHIGVIG